MRRALAPALPPSLYRHFAAVTLAVTLGLAMFADGENREARAAQTTRLEPAPPPKPATFATPSPRSDDRPTPRWWNAESDFDREFGSPMDRRGRSGGSSIVPEMVPAAPSAEAPRPLTRTERELLLKRLRESALPSAGEAE